MNLQEACDLSSRRTAELIIKNPDDPCGFGKRSPGIGTIYLWTAGHTVPVMICGFRSDMPSHRDQEQCVCGDRHGFPKRQKKLLYGLMQDLRWEPTFPIWEGKHPLDALAQVADV